jgi:hypothetical protein
MSKNRFYCKTFKAKVLVLDAFKVLHAQNPDIKIKKEAVQKCIWRIYGITMPFTTIGNYMRFSPTAKHPSAQRRQVEAPIEKGSVDNLIHDYLKIREYCSKHGDKTVAMFAEITELTNRYGIEDIKKLVELSKY